MLCREIYLLSIFILTQFLMSRAFVSVNRLIAVHYLRALQSKPTAAIRHEYSTVALAVRSASEAHNLHLKCHQRYSSTQSFNGNGYNELSSLAVKQIANKDDKNKKYTKSNLPSKMCTVCNRPFEWRKKWEKVWDEVKYCSERCRRARTSSSNSSAMTPRAAGGKGLNNSGSIGA